MHEDSSMHVKQNDKCTPGFQGLFPVRERRSHLSEVTLPPRGTLARERSQTWNAGAKYMENETRDKHCGQGHGEKPKRGRCGSNCCADLGEQRYFRESRFSRVNTSRPTLQENLPQSIVVWSKHLGFAWLHTSKNNYEKLGTSFLILS